MKHNQQRKRTGKSERRGSVPLFERIQPDAAGVDCGQKSHFVAVPPERDPEPVREFRTFTVDLQRLAEWLARCGVKTVAMESTGVYWIPLYEILEQRGFEVVLVNARDVHNVRGRKSDVKDCEWLQQLHSVGLLRASFRPAAAMVPLRSYLRQRAILVEELTARIQCMQKALTEMNLMLHTVVSDITGVTGLKIIRAILAGARDPERLALHRDGRCHASHHELVAALTGNCREEHLFSLRQNFTAYQFHLQQIAECDAEIEALLNTLAAQQPPPSANRAAVILRRCAMSLGRTSTALGAFYRRLAVRIGKAKASTATARKLAVLVYRVLSGDLVYNDPGATAYHQLNRARELKSLRQRAKLLGFELVDRSSGEVLLNPVS